MAAATAACVALVGFVDVAGDEDLGRRRGARGRCGRRGAGSGHPRCAAPASQRRGRVRGRGECSGVYHKRRLPNYGVFDEERWFAPGTSDLELYEVAGVAVGVSICEDLWFADGPVPLQAAGGAPLVVNVNASPYSIGRDADRLAVARARVAEAGCAIAYVNQVGGQDELVFDGGSFVMDAVGRVVGAAPRFVETSLVVDLPVPSRGPRPASCRWCR